MPFFRPGPGPYALALAMTGVRLGERFLELGSGTPALFGALAAKVGLTGRAVGVAGDSNGARALERAAAKEGVLVEVQVAPGPLPFDEDAFDLVVFDSTAGAIDARTPWAAEGFRVLRSGGRMIVAERTTATGLRALFGGAPAPSGPANAAIQMLQMRGFRPVRTIAERDGWRFTEGMKRRG
jgi:ubiquinone/menaquinone biosynthesis C-methylase UbiE